jgi:hypothetical protein
MVRVEMGDDHPTHRRSCNTTTLKLAAQLQIGAQAQGRRVAKSRSGQRSVASSMRSA